MRQLTSRTLKLATGNDQEWNVGTLFGVGSVGGRRGGGSAKGIVDGEIVQKWDISFLHPPCSVKGTFGIVPVRIL